MTMKNINSKDLKILAELVHNSKATLTNLGDKLGLHPNVVAYRINKLENLGIIRDYTVNLDLEKLGLSEQVYLGASFPANSKRDTVIRQISDLPQTITVVSSFGSPEVIFHLIGKSKEDIDRVITKLREYNVKIDYAASVIKTYQNGSISDCLKNMADGIELDVRGETQDG